MPDWDAQRYHRLSEPQLAWGRTVLARLETRPGDRVLDIGCGTGRLTAELARRPGVLVVGLDPSATMTGHGRTLATEEHGTTRATEEHGTTRKDTSHGRTLKNTGGSPDPSASAGAGRPVPLVRADGAFLPFSQAFDAVFSTATFHWIPDHARLFEGIHRVLTPGGRLVAQCGGGPNLHRLLARAHALMEGPFAAHFGRWSDPWYFADVSGTSDRLARAGFRHIQVSLEQAPTSFADAAAFGEFISCVCVRHHVDRLPPAERGRFVAALAEHASADDPPFTLDYWRLNIFATR